jgi:hypothetical protein
MSNTILDSIPRPEREAVVSFMDMSSRKAGSAEEIPDSIRLSLSLKQRLRGTPN